MSFEQVPVSLNPAPLDSLLVKLAEAPATQIDTQITARLAELVGQEPVEVAPALKQILDECAYAALASDFAMVAMDHAWKAAQQLVDEAQIDPLEVEDDGRELNYPG